MAAVCSCHIIDPTMAVTASVTSTVTMSATRSAVKDSDAELLNFDPSRCSVDSAEDASGYQHQ